MSHLCEAAALDAAVFGSWGDGVPPCDELGDVPVPAGEAHYLLCGGCAAALEGLVAFGEASLRGRALLLGQRRAQLLRRAEGIRRCNVAFLLVVLPLSLLALLCWARS